VAFIANQAIYRTQEALDVIVIQEGELTKDHQLHALRVTQLDGSVADLDKELKMLACNLS
jgi:hypothetical protein